VAGWCDNWGTIEWADEFNVDELDKTKWSVVCNDLNGIGCDSLPFVTHSPSNGAECRSATCIPSAVSVNDGYYF
jgi:hypothetical protein